MNTKLINFLENENYELTKNFKFNPIKKYKKILIVGSNGLIGINLVFALINLKKRYRNFNPSITLFSKSKPKISLIRYYKKNNINFKKENIINSIKTNKSFDLIFFAAGYSSPNKFTNSPEVTLLIHSLGLVNIASKLTNKGTLVYLSSSEVYNGLNHSFTENLSGNTNYNNKRAPYINGKKFGETYCQTLKEKGFNVKILRISLTYGPGTKINDSRVINEMIIKGIKDKNIRLIDKGKDIRKYLYISDCIEIIFKIVNKSKFNIYNVSGKSKTTIINLAKLISKKLQVKVTIPKIEKRLKDAPKKVNINNKRILTELDKKKFYNISQGLNKTIQWYKILTNKNK